VRLSLRPGVGMPMRRPIPIAASIVAVSMAATVAAALGASPRPTPAAPPAPICADSELPAWARTSSRLGDGMPDPAGRIVFGPETRMDDIFGEVVSLYAIDPDGSDLVRLLDCETMRPRFSPDGSRLAFGIAMDDGSIQVATMAVDGTNLRILTSTPGYAEQPDWSPDGSWIIYAHAPMHCPDPDCAIPGGYHESLWRMDIDGTGQRPIDGPSRLDGDPASLPAITQDIEPRFSPDGTEVVFDRSDGPDYRTTPMIRDLATGAERPATGNLRKEMHADWSRDGRWIIYNTDTPRADGSYFEQVERVPADDPTAEPVVLYPADADHLGYKPTYSPDGTSIAFLCEGRLCTMDADGSNVRVLVQPGRWDATLNHVAWGIVPKAPTGSASRTWPRRTSVALGSTSRQLLRTWSIR